MSDKNLKYYDDQFYKLHASWENDYFEISKWINDNTDGKIFGDIGCGNGYLIESLFSVYNKDIWGVDGSKYFKKHVKKEILPFVKEVDLTKEIILEKSDVTICFEVAEHIENKYSDILIDNILSTNAKTILFTAAPPGQPGINHINLQPHKYWINKFKKKGYSLNLYLGNKFKNDLSDKLKYTKWYLNNIMIFEKNNMKAPKLIMTLLARDEGDIIEKNIEFHLNHGVDFIIATDNASGDNTRDVFIKYQKEGKLYLIDEPGRDISQSNWNNRMAEIAINNYKADIVFHCDADEFWSPKSGNLKTEIWNSSVDVFMVNLINILLENKKGIESFPEDAKYAVVNPIETENFQEDSKKENLYFFRYPPKVIFKTLKGLLKVSEGNHSIINQKSNIINKPSENINIYHFPLRNKKRFYKKIINYGEALKRNQLLSRDVSWHIRRWFDAYKSEKLDEEYNKLMISREKAIEMQRIGTVESFDFKNFFNKSRNKDWEYYIPVFEYEKEFQDISWSWAGHKFFSYDLIRNIKPKRIVELGTYKGTSFFSFCQAVKDGDIKTEVNAIDIWEGDKHTGFYGDDIYKFVRTIVNKLYSNVKIKLIRKTFDDAISEFKDKSINILHIDGLHTYEAVKHDFENWLVKVKDDGIILFHDIKVEESDFGVHKLWEELKEKYQTMEFHHSFGLGILFKNKCNINNKIIKLQKELQMHYYYIYERIKNEKINSSVSLIKYKDSQIEQKDNQIRQKDNQIKWKDNQIKQEIKRIEQLNKTLNKLEKLNNTYLGKLNWAVHNPRKFIKKYLKLKK